MLLKCLVVFSLFVVLGKGYRPASAIPFVARLSKARKFTAGVFSFENSMPGEIQGNGAGRAVKSRKIRELAGTGPGIG